ncbi:MAG TPA: ATPase, T2SS/T4P/T4SS family [Burkholderiaceae bacterium]
MRLFDLLIHVAEETDFAVSDIHIDCGMPPALRLPDGLRSVRGYEGAVRASDIEDLLRDLGLDAQDILARVAAGGGQTRLSVTSIQGVAFRLAITRFGGLTASGRGGLFGLAMRRLRPTAPTFAELGLPEEISELATLKRGLVLITGETGAGKSTTLASLIEYLNSQSNLRIVTIEEPIEYRFESRRSLIQQREVGFDVPTFEQAVEHTLQQDPDVIVIGEIRNLATLQAAFRAASSGHLVYATLHTASAAKTLQRIQDLYPIEFRHQALSDTAAFLAAVISQTLLPSRDGKRRHLAHEIMTVTPKLRGMVRDAKWLQIRGELDRRLPLAHLLNHSLAELVANGFIDQEVARAASEDAADLESRVAAMAVAGERRGLQ